MKFYMKYFPLVVATAVAAIAVCTTPSCKFIENIIRTPNVPEMTDEEFASYKANVSETLGLFAKAAIEEGDLTYAALIDWANLLEGLGKGTVIPTAVTLSGELNIDGYAGLGVALAISDLSSRLGAWVPGGPLPPRTAEILSAVAAQFHMVADQGTS